MRSGLATMRWRSAAEHGPRYNGFDGPLTPYFARWAS